MVSSCLAVGFVVVVIRVFARNNVNPNLQRLTCNTSTCCILQQTIILCDKLAAWVNEGASSADRRAYLQDADQETAQNWTTHVDQTVKHMPQPSQTIHASSLQS